MRWCPGITSGRRRLSGTLKAAGLVIPTPAGEVAIEALDLRAAGNRLTASSSTLALEEQRLSVTGNATFQDEGIVLDMDAATSGIAWEHVEKVLDRMKSQKKVAAGTKEREPSSFPISGILRLSIGSFTFRDLAWKPVLADIELAKESVGRHGEKRRGLRHLDDGRASVSPRRRDVRHGPCRFHGPGHRCLADLSRVRERRDNGTLRSEPPGRGKGKGGGAFPGPTGPARVPGFEWNHWQDQRGDESSGGRQHDAGLRGQRPGPDRRGDALRRIHRRRADGKRAGLLRFARRPSSRRRSRWWEAGQWDSLDKSLDLTILARPFSTVDGTAKRSRYSGTFSGGISSRLRRR